MRTNRLFLPLGLVTLGLALAAPSRAQDGGKETPKAPAEKPPGFIGIQMDAVALEGSPARSAIRVVGLVPGSPAEAVGVKAGDLVLALDGQGFEGVPVGETVQRFRDRLKPHTAGDTVRLQIRRETVTVETHVAGVATGTPATASGAAWNEALPDLKRLVESNPEKVVTVSAERSTWEREVKVVLVERPGTRATPLPDNDSLRPDLAARPYEPEAELAQRLIVRAGLAADYADLRRRLEEDEKVEDAFRLKTVRFLKRDGLRLPGATKDLARALAPLARTSDLAALGSLAGTLLDAPLAPILTTLAPSVPPPHASVEAHVEYCLALMRRSRDLVALAFRGLTLDEQRELERDLPTLAAKFEEGIYLHEDPDPARWKRHQTAIERLARVERAPLLASLAELAPLASPAYLEQLEADLREAEGRSRGVFGNSWEQLNGWFLYRGSSDLGSVAVGGSGPNGYREDCALIIDLGGDDKYYRRAGGACGLARPVAVCLDLSGDDVYQATEPFAQGAALMGCGLLVDRRGNDRYTTLEGFAQGASLAGAAALVDQDGDDLYRGGSYAQGAALAVGVAALLDGGGADEHEAGLYAQGFAGPGALGVLVAHGGNDRYSVVGRKKCSYGDDGVFDAHSQGSSCGFRGPASGGIAALVDDGGDDVYEAGNFSQGCGYSFGWGVLADLGGGNDRYSGSRYAQGAAAHSALGSLYDDGGNDRYSAWIGAAQSLAWDLCVTAVIDEGGDDVWDGGLTRSQGAAAHNGLALFYDASGCDTYRTAKQAPALSGPNDYHGGGSLAIFIDAGGEPNVYDLGENVAFVPSRGVTVLGEKTLFADLPARVSGFDNARLEALFPGK